MVIEFPVFTEYFPEGFSEEILRIFYDLPAEDRDSYVISFKNYFFEKAADNEKYPQTIIIGANLKNYKGENLPKGVNYLLNSSTYPALASQCEISLCINQDLAPSRTLNLTKFRKKYDIVRPYSMVLSKPLNNELSDAEIIDIITEEYQKYFIKKYTQGEDEIIYTNLSDLKSPAQPRGTITQGEVRNKYTSGILGDVYASIVDFSPMKYAGHRVLLYLDLVYSFNLPDIPGLTKESVIQRLDEQYSDIVYDFENHLNLLDPYVPNATT